MLSEFWGIGLLLTVFLACLVLTLRAAALRALLSLLLAIFFVGLVIPAAALRGLSPLLVGLPTGLLLLGAGCIIIGGWNHKSAAAALGAGTSLILAAALPLALAHVLQISGLECDFGPRLHLEVKFWYDPAFGQVDFAQLRLVGIILASLGALIDVALVIASSLEQMGPAGARDPFGRRFRVGLRIGGSVFGPMLATMILIFFGAELATLVARATVRGNFWEALRWLNYESTAVEVLETAAAGVGLLACIPLSALFSAWLLSESKSRDTPSDCAANPPRSGGLAPQMAAGLAILLACLAVDQTFIAAHDGEPVTCAEQPDVRSQRCLAKVVDVQPAIVLPADPAAPFNPVRGPVPTQLVPSAAKVLTGENRGRTVVFINRLQGRPYVDVRLRRGALALLSVSTREGVVTEATLYPVVLRWRPLLWAVAAILAAAVAALGRDGWRAAVLCVTILAVLSVLTAPLIGRGAPPALVAVITFTVVAGAMLLLWGTGWRERLCAAIGTLAGLLAGGIVAFSAICLLGLDSSASALIRLLKGRPGLQNLSFEQLLAAGAALMATGAALDIAASIVGGLVALRRANPSVTAAELRRAGLRLNRDIAPMMVLTSFFAWLAVHLSVILLMHRSAEAFSQRWIACYTIELARFVSASTAILLAGPFTALIFPAIVRGPACGRENHSTLERSLVLITSGLIALVSVASLVHTSIQRVPLHTTEPPPGKGVSLTELVAAAEERQGQRDWDGSIILLWRARATAPDEPIVARDLAYAYLARHWPELARATLEPALPALADDARSHYIRGILSWWENDLETAKAELQRAITLDPALTHASEALAQMP